ncbi:MAG: ABC transporter permease [Anaerolineae bacterium]|nr:ABC transporter permease [Anaerolineae bacterium]
MWIVFRKELGQYFNSPLAYLIMAGFLFLTGLWFNSDLTFSVGTKAPDPALIPFNLSFFMVFLAPVLTMRLFAEETREGTLELLLTAPVRERDIVLGKFLSAWCFFSILLLITLIYQGILISISRPDLGHTIAAYLGIWLYGGATLGVGLLFSALTENQVLAAFLSTSVLAFLWLGDLAGAIVANIDLARVIREITLQGHFSDSFAYGLMRVEDVVYFAGVIAITLFLTMRVVESRRWR